MWQQQIFECFVLILLLALLGYLDQGLMVKDPKLLRKNYTTTPFVYLDILSVLPTDIAYFFLDKKCIERVPCTVIGNIKK